MEARIEGACAPFRPTDPLPEPPFLGKQGLFVFANDTHLLLNVQRALVFKKTEQGGAASGFS